MKKGKTFFGIILIICVVLAIFLGFGFWTGAINSSGVTGHFLSLKSSPRVLGANSVNLTLANPQVSCVSGVSQVSLVWVGLDNAKSYTVERQSSRNRWVGISSTLPNSTTVFVDKSLGTATGAFNYRIRAVVATSRYIRTSNVYSNIVPAVVGACVVATSTVPVVPTSTPPATQGSKVWGAYVGYKTTDAATFESLVGAKMNMQAIFIHWGNENAFPSQFSATVRDKNKTLVIFWESDDYNFDTTEQSAYNYDSILRGSFDAYIKQFALDAKAYGGPVILVPFHEMNGNWSTWSGTLNGNTPEKHVAAFRYIKNLFSTATNVKFAWAVNNDSVPDTAENQFEKYYPGDAYVDYVGIDGFNFGNPWQTWSDVFASGLNRLAVYSKPIYIFSLASAPGSAKANWITTGLGSEIYNYPKVAGWIWFNENKERDWRVNSDAASLSAFKQVVSKISQ